MKNLMATAQLWNELLFKKLEPFVGMPFNDQTLKRIQNVVYVFRCEFFSEHQVHYTPLPIIRPDIIYMPPSFALVENFTPFEKGNHEIPCDIKRQEPNGMTTEWTEQYESVDSSSGPYCFEVPRGK